MSTLKIEHIANIANSGPDISIDTSGHLNIVNGSLQMGGTTMLDTSDTTLKNVSKIGIGTATPGYKLHLHESSSSESYQLFTNSTTGATTSDGFRIGIDSNENALIWHREANSIQFATSNDTKMIILANGNVGIGTTNAGQKLTVAGGIEFNNGSGDATELSTSNFSSTYDANGKAMQIISGGTFTVKNQSNNPHISTSDSEVKLYTSATPRVIIDTNGRVGIGITPAAVSDSTGANSLQLGGSFLVHFDEDGSGTTSLSNNVYWNGTNNIALFYGSASQYYQTGGQHIWRSSGITSAGGNVSYAERMKIDSSGNVGINTVSPASALDVKGDLRITRNVAAGHASEGNWNFTVSMAGASDYGSLYLTPSVSTGEFTVMGDKFRVTQSSGIQITSDSSNSTSSDNVAIRYNGTAGAHQSGYLFKDKRDAVNAAVKNNLRDDGVGTAAAFLEFHTSTGGTLSKAMSIGRYGEVAFDKMPNFATRPYYTDTSLAAGAVVDMYDAHVNVGNHFNGSTNRFTAPYAGNYYFAFHSNIYRPTGSGVIYFNWHKNGTNITTTYGGRFYGYWTGGWENMMGFIVLPLAANDYIDLRAGGGGPKVDGGAYGQFVGYALTTP